MLINCLSPRSVILFLLLFSLLSPVQASADNTIPADSAKVFAAYKADTGGSAWDTLRNSMSVVSVRQGGLTEVVNHWEDDTTGCYADHATRDGISSMGGFGAMKPWNADSAGIAHYQDSASDLRSAVTSSYMIESAFLFPGRHAAVVGHVQAVRESGRNYSVISVAPSGGDPIDLWFDNKTHYLVKTVQHTSMSAVTAEYSDFRKLAGMTSPFVCTVFGSERQFQSVDATTSKQTNISLPTDIFNPPTSTVDYTINGGMHAVTVPFVFKNGKILVPVEINGLGPFNAALDSGAQLGITPEFAKKYNIPYSGILPCSGIGANTADMGYAKLATLQIGDITLESPDAGVLALPLPRDNPLIGAEIFNRFVVTIDFDKQQLTLTPTNLFKYTGPGVGVSIHFYGNIPVAEGTVDGVVGQFEIDTGNSNPVALNSEFVRSNSLLKKYHPVFSGEVGVGVGGSIHGSVAWAKDVSLGIGLVGVPNTLLLLSDAKEGLFADTTLSGNISMMFLDKFNLTFDYGHQIIYFQFNSNYGNTDAQDGLGISFTQEKNGELVTYVVPGSVAASEGIAPGDLITAVNGKSLAGSTGVPLFEQIINPAGTVLQLTIVPAQKPRVLSVTLDPHVH